MNTWLNGLKKHKKHPFLTIFLCYLISSSQYSFARTSKLTTNQATDLTIVTESLPPFQLLDNNKNITGYSTDVIKEVLKQTPYHYSLVMHPWTQSYDMAIKNKNTCIYSIARELNREPLFQWIGQIASTNTYFISFNTSKRLNIKSINDAKQYMTAVIKDDYTHQALIKNGFIENKNYFVINNSDSLLRLLISRENIDLVLVDDFTMGYRLKQNGLDPQNFIKYVKINQHPLKFYFACSNNTSKDIVNSLQKAFIHIETNGAKERIKTNWLNKNVGILND